MKTQSISLRKWVEEDAEDLVRFADNINIAKYLRDIFPHPYREKNALEFINYILSEDPACTFVIDLEGVAIGSIGVSLQTDIFRMNAELGYWVAEPYWGRGIATQAIRLMVDHVFHTFDVVRIYAVPFGSNIASQKVLEKCGFQLEARLSETIFKNGNYEDELIYGLRKSERK